MPKQPLVLKTVAELRAWRKSLDRFTIGFVPTMGALHAGHLSLVQKSKASCDRTLVSIFVNPTQFGPAEDFAKYPRTLESDLALLQESAVDAVFSPGVSEIYPEGSSTFVVEEMVSASLCGEVRPGHFRGVATVVLKLLNLVQPSVAYFGQKDGQQCAVIERMVRDLNVPVRIVRGETVREKDGLALSSRNVYLSESERVCAPQIYLSMKEAERAFLEGERDAQKLMRIGRGFLEREPQIKIQYWEIRDVQTLESLSKLEDRGALIAVAAVLGKTRLIDNLEFEKI